MTEENRIAFEKFDDHLQLRKKEGVLDAKFDIREWVLSNRYAAWNVGYLGSNMSKKYGANLRKLFPNALSLDDKGHGNSQHYMLLGTIYQDSQKSHGGGVRALQSYQPGDTLLFFEQGFLATSHSWSEAFKENDPTLACLGYVYDDISNYFMSDFPNRLINRLNSSDEPSEKELLRSRKAIDRLVEQKVSKYNSQPIIDPVMSGSYERRVLVCDQAFADASTIYGKLTENDFQKMLLAAIQENPDAQIIVKTHPDTHWGKGKRTGYFSHLEDVGRVVMMRDPINPYCIFPYVDKVYVGSSQIGLEALFAGKEVVCFGAAFYSGWGLTDDRQEIPHRGRKRSLEEIFYYFYIWYTIYHVPNCPVPSEVEDAIDYIVEHRPVRDNSKALTLPANPKISVIVPVYDVSQYLEECLKSIQRQTFTDIEIIVINDASPDNSAHITDLVAQDDNRINHIVLDNNIGLGPARNLGIQAAKGDFVFFIDSDDLFLSSDVLERAYDAAIENKAEMVRVQKWSFKDGHSPKTAKPDGKEKYFRLDRSYLNASIDPEILQSWHCWQFLYSAEFLKENDILFLTRKWEERAFVCKAQRLANHIYSLPIPGIGYRQRVSSITGQERTDADMDMFLDNIYEVINELKGTPSEAVATYQMMHALLMAKWRNLLYKMVEMHGDTAVINKLRHAFHLDKTDNLDGIKRCSISQFREIAAEQNRLFLALAALCAFRWDMFEIAARTKSILQVDYIAEMLHVPKTEVEQQLQEALSLYARNDLVTTKSEDIPKGQNLEKKPRLIIHIGSTKTGSTFIQHFLEKNRAALLRGGLYVPEVGLFWQQTRPHKQAGHADFVAEAVQGKSKLKEHVDAAIALTENRIHTVILSSEAYFLNSNAIELARHFSDYDVEIVTYLRRQDDWSNSQYAEFVAGGAVGRVDTPIEEWLKTDQTRNRLNYYGQMKLWETVVDKSKIHIGVYDRARLKDDDIISDFLELAQLQDYTDLPRPEAEQENRFPFGTAHVNLIRRLNKNTWPDRNAYFNFIEDAGQRVSQLRKRNGLSNCKLNLLTNMQRQSVLDSVAQTNASLAKEYLGRDDGLLFEPLVSRDDDILDVISSDEFDAIMQAYDTWAPKGAKRNHQRKAKRQKNKNAKFRNGLITAPRTQDSLFYKTFSMVSYPFLSTRKRKKLSEQPNQFFKDSNKSYVQLTYKAIDWEKSIRSDPGSNHVSLLPTDKTLVAKTFTLAGQRMGPNKLAKLKNSPDMFFRDMNGKGATAVRRVLMFERRLRG